MIIWWIQLLCVFQYTASGSLLDMLFAPSKCKADAKEPWSYRGENGPKNWGERYPMCNGQEQTPVAISSRNALRDPDLPRLALQNYDIPLSTATVVNNGHTIQVTPSDGIARTIFVNGNNYSLAQFHFHWGDAFYRGAEHTVDGVQYSMELHFVHLNADKQIAVVGVFFQEQSRTNSELDKIIASFPKVMYKNTSDQLRISINLNNLVPSNPSSYFRYQGSLTTPNCAEGVTWSVLRKPLPVGLTQMAEFRKLYSATKSDATKNCKLSDNYRPIQPLNKRKVYISQ